MGRICESLSENTSADEVSLRDLNQIDAETKLIIFRALKNVNPDSRQLYQCIRESVKKFLTDQDCAHNTHKEAFNDCDCSSVDTSELDAFCDRFKSRPRYDECELLRFAEIILEKLDNELSNLVVNHKPRPCEVKEKPEYCIVPVIISDSEDSSSTASERCDCTTSDSSTKLCACDLIPKTCSESKALLGVCKSHVRPIVFRHAGDALTVLSEIFDKTAEPFEIGDVGPSEEIGKWGDFLDFIEHILQELNFRLSGVRPPTEDDCCGDTCIRPTKRDRFEDLDRFKNIHLFGFSIFCRKLMRWSNCITKRWNCVTSCPHLVIHLPSMSYPCHLRSKAKQQFGSLQNIQIGRLGWLVNEKAQVLYVYPGKSDFETKCILQSFVRIARPDVSLSRLWIIENDDECLCEEVDEEYRSGCESLFYTPRVYRRLRHLTAGRHGFIIPGVLSKTDVLIACELRTPIIGPCLKFQERLLNKLYVMSMLAEAGLRHPVFAGVRNFRELCEKMAEMVIKEPRKCEAGESKWLVKVNCGFCGNQSALVCLERRVYRFMGKDELQLYLVCELPRKLKVSKGVYSDTKEFFVELERHGGVLTVCPEGDYQTVSLGCFIEHDTAKACLRTTADVLRTRQEPHSCSWNDVGYIIPQTSLPVAWIEELMVRLGDVLSLEQHIGFFGVDVVVFRDRQQVLDYWVVDIDPYYTDLLSFDDWRRFCLNIPICASFSPFPTALANCKNANPTMVSSEHRFVVCSGKLYLDGLSTLATSTFLVDLCKKHRIAYSHKARTGCMICPIDNEKRAYLMFSFCRSRDTALRHFIRALKALHSASIGKNKPPLLGSTTAATASSSRSSSNILSLARDVEQVYGINDDFFAGH